MSATDLLVPAAAALGIGLMVGLERERKKGRDEQRGAVGLRTCAVTALLGHVAMVLGGIPLLAVSVLVLGALVTATYLRDRSDDPGITSEVALLLTACLGALAVTAPGSAVALAVVLTALLALREHLHHFATRWINPAEARDGLILATAALVILPLLPDQHMGPFAAINPHDVWKFTVLLMAISALGHIATRMLGARHGLMLAGFISGFASSTATIASMGARSREEPAQLLSCAAAAVLSTVATLVQMTVILLAGSPDLLPLMQWPLLAGVLTAVAFAVIASRRVGTTRAQALSEGSVFDLRLVLMMGLAIASISLLAAALLHWLGEQGLVLATAMAGFADAHSPAISVTTLVHTDRLTPAQGVLPLLAALTTNTLSKLVVAWSSGGAGYFWRVAPGLVAVLVALWVSLPLAQ